MTMLSTAETAMRPASTALAGWFGAEHDAASGPRRTALASEQAEVTAAITALVAKMDDDGIEPEALDDLTEGVAALLGRAEEIRLALALADRAADETWLVSLDLD